MESKRSDLKRFLIGTLIGIVSVVPGVSGAILAVCFGVYERLIADLAYLRRKIREDFRFLMAIGLGLVFGIVLASMGLDFILENYLLASMMLFTGLILGQLPELWKLTEPDTGFSKPNIAAFVVGVAVMCVFLVLGASEEKDLSGHDVSAILYMVIIGIIYAVSHLAPGISGSTVLLAIGLLAPLTHTIATLDFVLLVPLVIGTLIGLITFAKAVHYAIVHHRKSTYMMIFGLMIGSFLVIIKEAVDAYAGTADLVLGVIALAAGILLSIWFSSLGKKTKEEFSSE
jgi:putative membrane protein